jgi:hypothetical protein
MRPSPPSSGSRLFRALLAFGVFGGGVAWVLHLGLSYAAVPRVCAEGDVGLLHVLTAGTGLLAAGAVAASLLTFRISGRVRKGVAGRRREADRFLSLVGVLLSGFFLVLILVEGLPALVAGDPCDAVPTLDGPVVWTAGFLGAAGPPMRLAYVGPTDARGFALELSQVSPPPPRDSSRAASRSRLASSIPLLSSSHSPSFSRGGSAKRVRARS